MLVSVSLALPLIDHLALLLVPGAAVLVELGIALLMDGLLDSPGQVNALHLGDRVALGHHDGGGLGHIITWIFQPLRDERQIQIPWHRNKLIQELVILT